MGSEVDSRLEELECRVALQDESIETLSEQIYKQQQQLVKIEDDIALIKDWIKAAISSSQEVSPTGEEPPPPHY